MRSSLICRVSTHQQSLASVKIVCLARIARPQESPGRELLYGREIISIFEHLETSLLNSVSFWHILLYVLYEWDPKKPGLVKQLFKNRIGKKTLPFSVKNTLHTSFRGKEGINQNSRFFSIKHSKINVRVSSEVYERIHGGYFPVICDILRTSSPLV